MTFLETAVVGSLPPPPPRSRVVSIFRSRRSSNESDERTQNRVVGRDYPQPSTEILLCVFSYNAVWVGTIRRRSRSPSTKLESARVIRPITIIILCFRRRYVRPSFFIIIITIITGIVNRRHLIRGERGKNEFIVRREIAIEFGSPIIMMIDI